MVSKASEDLLHALRAPIHSMSYLRRREIDIERTVEVWTEFIIGGRQTLEKRYRLEADAKRDSSKDDY